MAVNATSVLDGRAVCIVHTSEWLRGRGEKGGDGVSNAPAQIGRRVTDNRRLVELAKVAAKERRELGYCEPDIAKDHARQGSDKLS